MACENCTRMERLLHAAIAGQSAAVMESRGVPAPLTALAAEGLADVAVQGGRKAKRKASAYSRRYGAAYRRIRKQHTLKNGKLRKGWSHKKIVKAAHAAAKRK